MDDHHNILKRGLIIKLLNLHVFNYNAILVKLIKVNLSLNFDR